MPQHIIHVYFVPGLAAGKEIFRNIKLPKNRFKTHIIEWLIPEKNETIANYSKRMAAMVIEKNAILIGVSFGGVVVQEMSAFLDLKKLIIISSIKSKHELPLRLKIVRKLKAYYLMPTRLVVKSKDLTKLAIGPRSKKRLKIYDEYLHVRNERYLNWAIKNMVCWNREISNPNVYHIHGNEDVVFPIKNLKTKYIIDGGTHIMLLRKGHQITDVIIEIIEEN
ncbi:alpha/beta hydrolase [Patiriisocius marinistellae]|uniref:Alpha/beta hydrolase n=1 Tax=Patiriisocius marinistellae TaxID=2494560 RepID=A0A5J4G0U7_9FLAO|nr:alpha/beta hydrolase [Patiriisocius marinistellae]GEQ85965.1 alpha/beta hydrolase [Patiriisocius marinistellae]